MGRVFAIALVGAFLIGCGSRRQKNSGGATQPPSTAATGATATATPQIDEFNGFAQRFLAAKQARLNRYLGPDVTVDLKEGSTDLLRTNSLVHPIIGVIEYESRTTRRRSEGAPGWEVDRKCRTEFGQHSGRWMVLKDTESLLDYQSNIPGDTGSELSRTRKADIGVVVDVTGAGFSEQAARDAQ